MKSGRATRHSTRAGALLGARGSRERQAGRCPMPWMRRSPPLAPLAPVSAALSLPRGTWAGSGRDVAGLAQGSRSCSPSREPVLRSFPPQLLHQDEPLPTACDPADVSHGYVPIRVRGGTACQNPRAGLRGGQEHPGGLLRVVLGAGCWQSEVTEGSPSPAARRPAALRGDGAGPPRVPLSRLPRGLALVALPGGENWGAGTPTGQGGGFVPRRPRACPWGCPCSARFCRSPRWLTPVSASSLWR